MVDASAGVPVKKRDPRGPEPDLLRRYLLAYPVVVLLLALAVWMSLAGDEGDAEEDATPPAVESEPAKTASSPPDVDAEARETGALEGLLDRGRDASLATKAGVGAIAGLFGERLGRAVRYVDEHVDAQDLVEGGKKLARFIPFVGPCLRFDRAREMYRSGDAERQARARRQTVIALAELGLDVGSAGLGRAASGSAGMLEAMEGAVDVADFSDFLLAINEELDESVQLGGLSVANAAVDRLAGQALVEVEGLEDFVETLLQVEPREIVGDLSSEMARRAEALLESLSSGEPGER